MLMDRLAAAVRLLIHAVRYELSLYRSLVLWILRRRDVPAGATAYTSHRMVTPVMWLWIFASAMEVPLVHVLVPWEGLRIALLAVSVWGLVWMVGLLASLSIHPHLASADGLRVRRGATIDLQVPWSAVESARLDERDLPSTIRSLQPLETPDGVDLQIGMSGRTNVHLALREPRVFDTPKGPLTVVAVSFWADEPRAVVSAAVSSR